MLHAISAAVLALLVSGAVMRKRWELHAACMGTAFVLDLALLLYIELTRKAVATVAGGPSPLVLFHAAVSTAVLVLYLTQFGLARAALAGRGAGRSWHIALGLSLLLLRFVNFATSFQVAGAGARAAQSPAMASAR